MAPNARIRSRDATAQNRRVSQRDGVISKDAYERLWLEIASGKLNSGSILREAAIADRYGVSRTPVREALRRLEQDGLVQRSDRGIEVRSYSPDEILEIYAVRIVLEGLAARLAAESRTDLDLANLERRHSEMVEMDAQHPDAANANRLFHETLWQSSHNKTLVELLNRLNVHLVRYPTTTLTNPGRWGVVLLDHRSLIDAIRNRHIAHAANIAETHMTAARDIRLQMCAAQGL